MPTLDRIENPQMMEIYVNGPRDANRLYIFAGTAVFNWHGTDDENWIREPLQISLIGIPGVPRIFRDQVVDHVETASLAAIYSRETARRDAVGFAADSVQAFFIGRRSPRDEPDFADFGVNIQLALRGNDVRLLRVSFQLNILARV